MKIIEKEAVVGKLKKLLTLFGFQLGLTITLTTPVFGLLTI